MVKKNFKGFVKEHKKEIIICTIAALTGGVAGYLLKPGMPKWMAEASANIAKNPPKQLPLYKSAFGECTDFWTAGGTGNPIAIVRDINVQFLGDVGAEFMDYCIDNGIDYNFDVPVTVLMEWTIK